MKLKSLLLTAALPVMALPPPQPINISWTLSPADTNGSGQYTIVTLTTNAPSINAWTQLTNVPAGASNVVVQAYNCPPPPFFFMAMFTQGGVTSALSAPFPYSPSPLPVPSPFNLQTK